MVLFQNKIIYMPSMPPFSRSEKLTDYVNECKPVTWEEIDIKSLDGTKLKLLKGSMNVHQAGAVPSKRIVVVYFQGNGLSLPPRLPYLSSIMKMLQASAADVQCTLVALSYRGYWRSNGSANQKGIELDAQATLEWVAQVYGHQPETKVILWGQSIGAGVATTSLATWLKETHPTNLTISGLLLETPFTNLKAMLIALYPQKYLPYRYLGVFLQSTWDSEVVLAKIGERLQKPNGQAHTNGNSRAPTIQILLLEGEKDELVPQGDAERLLTVSLKSSAIKAEHKIVRGALHTNVMMKSQGKREISRFIAAVARDQGHQNHV